MEAAPCPPRYRSLRLFQTFGAAENSLNIPSMQALSAVLHVSASRPDSSHSADRGAILKPVIPSKWSGEFIAQFVETFDNRPEH